MAKVFQDTPAHSPLREHCVRVASRNARELYNGSADHKAFIAATADVPGFATQVMDMYLSGQGHILLRTRALRKESCDALHAITSSSTRNRHLARIFRACVQIARSRTSTGTAAGTVARFGRGILEALRLVQKIEATVGCKVERDVPATV